MQRDMTILRRVLLVVERDALEEFHDETDVWHHVNLAQDGGLVTTNYALTNKGRDFLELARDEETWQWVVTYIKERVGTAPFDIWVEVLALAQRQRLFKCPSPLHN